MRCCLAIVSFLAVASAAWAASPVATYEFNNNFLADQAGAPALTPIDPLGLSGFQIDTVLGISRPVWAFDGTEFPTNQQAGLTVGTSGLISPTNYTVDMVFQFTQRQSAWRRIIDVQNRQSDNGFYVDPSNNLDIFPISGSTNAWTNNVYHHVVLTNDGGTVNTYIDGVSQFTTATSLMNINNADNPGLLMGFFIDNVVAGGQGEFSDGKVALIRLWNGVLNSTDAQQVAANPFVTNYLKGDFDRDGLVNADDVPAMLAALTDLPAYKLSKSLDDAKLALIGDFTGDNHVTNSDVQPMLDLLGGGGPSIAPVPEPATLPLIAAGLPTFLFAIHVKRRLFYCRVDLLQWQGVSPLPAARCLK